MTRLPDAIQPNRVFCHVGCVSEILILPMHIRSKNTSAPKSKSILVGLWNSGSANIMPSEICKSFTLIRSSGIACVMRSIIRQSRFAVNLLILDCTTILTLLLACVDIAPKAQIEMFAGCCRRLSFLAQLLVIKQD